MYLNKVNKWLFQRNFLKELWWLASKSMKLTKSEINYFQVTWGWLLFQKSCMWIKIYTGIKDIKAIESQGKKLFKKNKKMYKYF